MYAHKYHMHTCAKHTCTHLHTHTDRHTDIHTYTRKDTQTDKQADTHKLTHLSLSCLIILTQMNTHTVHMHKIYTIEQ